MWRGLLEVNQQGDTHYLVMEFVPGRNLAEHLVENESLDEHEALAIMADVARALVEPHERGIVHRDIKPENIIIDRLTDERSRSRQADDASVEHKPAGPIRARLVDFGLARHFETSESLDMTREGSILGTPLYMPPEQGTGKGPIAPASDTYALGATLFHALVGRPPFVGSDPWELVVQHCDVPPPRVDELKAGIGDDITRVVDRSLAKSPSHRYPDARTLLVDLERLQRREPIPFQQHPQLPSGSENQRTLDYQFHWELAATPASIWPFVSDTERLNQAIGLRPADFLTQVDADGNASRIGSFSLAGVKLTWQEHPFEWIEGRRLSVLREFTEGPFKWFINIVELLPLPTGGTRLEHRILVEPRSVLGNAVAALELGVKARRSLARVYHRIDDFVMRKLRDDGGAFRKAPRLTFARRRRLRQSLQRLARLGIDDQFFRPLEDLLSRGAPQELARIRPLAFARQYDLDPDATLDALMQAAHEGLLVLLWDILCPKCRIPADVKGTLRDIKSHGQCPACNLDFELDFASSVEMVFRASPRVSKVDLGTYCIGGPAHSPHVAAQVRLAALERVELELGLEKGAYRLQCPQLPYLFEFQVDTTGGSSRHDFDLDETAPAVESHPCLTAKHQHVVLQNRTQRELLVRIERTVSRTDVLTAARAATMASFRRLFRYEILSPGELINVAAATFVVVDLLPSPAKESLGNVTMAFHTQSCAHLVTDCVKHQKGVVFKTGVPRLIAAFDDPCRAVRAALELQTRMQANEAGHDIRIAIDHGPAAITTINDQLHYVGKTAAQVEHLVEIAGPAELVMTSMVAGDPVVAEVLRENELAGAIQAWQHLNQPPVIVHRFSFPARR